MSFTLSCVAILQFGIVVFSDTSVSDVLIVLL
jgi:hypothetical protein